MPSYRVTMTIGSVAPGIAPESVVPSAADAVREVAIVEASDVAIVRGEPRVTVRFTGEDDAEAWRVARHGVERSAAFAGVTAWRLTRRDGGRWVVVRA